MRGETILKMNVVFTSKIEIRDRILTDIEFDVFQGALSHANAKHSCKLMRQASCYKIRRKPFACREVCSFRLRSAKGIEFGVRCFGIDLFANFLDQVRQSDKKWEIKKIFLVSVRLSIGRMASIPLCFNLFFR